MKSSFLEIASPGQTMRSPSASPPGSLLGLRQPHAIDLIANLNDMSYNIVCEMMGWDYQQGGGASYGRSQPLG